VSRRLVRSLRHDRFGRRRRHRWSQRHRGPAHPLASFHPFAIWVRSLAATVHPGHRTHGAASRLGRGSLVGGRAAEGRPSVGRSATGREVRRDRLAGVREESRRPVRRNRIAPAMAVDAARRAVAPPQLDGDLVPVRRRRRLVETAAANEIGVFRLQSREVRIEGDDPLGGLVRAGDRAAAS